MTDDRGLEQLAAEVGVLTSYRDWLGATSVAKPHVLLRVLQLLGLDIERPDDASRVLLSERRERWQRLVPPCAVAWGDRPARLRIRVPADAVGGYRVELQLQSGDTRTLDGRIEDVPASAYAVIERAAFVSRIVELPVPDLGYHEAVVSVGDRTQSCHIIAAPPDGYRLPRGKRWGVFAPTYALRGERPGGAGDVAELSRLATWAHERGADFVGALPLLSSFLDEPFEPSPYSPASRLFWNEFYIDIDSAPGIELSDAARKLMASPGFAAEGAALDALELVDYRRTMAHKRGVLQCLADAAWASGALREQLEAYTKKSARVADYARFRAVTEARGQVWSEWPAAMRDGEISDPCDYDERVWRYHVYAQYTMDMQLSRLDGRHAAKLYLDVPVGVNRAGYDVWRERDSFVLGASVGAPPDVLFSNGQNWGLPPLSPRAIRERGHRYFIDTIRHHVKHAGLVRIDHVMGLHRLFWIPDGEATRDGVYVNYAADEMYAIICLESQRHRCAITGEDLGTVPDQVRPAMHEHGLFRLYVAQYSLPGNIGDRIEQPPAASVASLNTHDTPTFHGFFHAQDIKDFHELGLFDAQQAERERAARATMCEATARVLVDAGLLPAHEEAMCDDAAVMRALLEFLARSDAEMVMVTLEDLWLSPFAHNVPGTSHERPNWRRRIQRRLRDITTDPDIHAILDAVAAGRRQ